VPLDSSLRKTFRLVYVFLLLCFLVLYVFHVQVMCDMHDENYVLRLCDIKVQIFRHLVDLSLVIGFQTL